MFKYYKVLCVFNYEDNAGRHCQGSMVIECTHDDMIIPELNRRIAESNERYSRQRHRLKTIPHWDEYNKVRLLQYMTETGTPRFGYRRDRDRV